MAKVGGVVFLLRSRYLKLVDIEWGDDNSFYFLPCQKEAEVGTRLKTEIDSNGFIKLKVNEIESGKFPVRKISRHPSGYYHVKNAIGREGNREKDGLIGPSFNSTDGFYIFLVIFAQAIDTLVELEAPSPRDLIINLPESIEPFSVQFAVWDKRINVKIPTPPGEFLGDGVIAITSDSQDYGMVVMLVGIKRTTRDVQLKFPARTCYIVR